MYTLLIKMFLAPTTGYSCVCWEHWQIHLWQYKARVLICTDPKKGCGQSSGNSVRWSGANNHTPVLHIKDGAWEGFAEQLLPYRMRFGLNRNLQKLSTRPACCCSAAYDKPAGSPCQGPGRLQSHKRVTYKPDWSRFLCQWPRHLRPILCLGLKSQEASKVSQDVQSPGIAFTQCQGLRHPQGPAVR